MKVFSPLEGEADESFPLWLRFPSSSPTSTIWAANALGVQLLPSKVLGTCRGVQRHHQAGWQLLSMKGRGVVGR